MCVYPLKKSKLQIVIEWIMFAISVRDSQLALFYTN